VVVSSSGEAPSLTLAAAAELMVGHFFIIDYNDQHINLQFAALGFGGLGEFAVLHRDEQEVGGQETLRIWSVGGSAVTWQSRTSIRDELQLVIDLGLIDRRL
jgi:hypothetical protein